MTYKYRIPDNDSYKARLLGMFAQTLVVTEQMEYPRFPHLRKWVGLKPPSARRGLVNPRQSRRIYQSFRLSATWVECEAYRNQVSKPLERWGQTSF